MNSLGLLGGLLDLPEVAAFEGDAKRAYLERDRIKRLLEARLVERTTAAWLELLRTRDVWCAEVKDFDGVFSDPQVLARELVQQVDHPRAGALKVIRTPISLSETPATIRRPPPLVGEHNAEILRDLCYDDTAIAGMEVAGVFWERKIPLACLKTARVDERLVIFEREVPVGIIRVNRERKLNAMNRPILDGLLAALDEVAGDPALHAAILTGTGRAFISGADINEYYRQGQAAFAEYQRRGRLLLERIERHPKPVIAAVNGLALGGGFELALACDLIVAGEGARFGLPEPRLGLVPGGGGTQRLTRAVGRFRAKEMLLAGRQLSAAEAQNWGLVGEVVPAGEELRAAQALATRIAELAPLAVRAAKRLINEGQDAALEAALSYEQQTLIALYATADGQEGVAAFMEKRPPRFSGH